jgi:putative hydrolase of the HAD superfamily
MPAGDRKWIALDAAGTLFRTAEPVETVYAACFSAHGFGIPESTWKNAFRQAFRNTPDPIYPDRHNCEQVEKQWWRDLVANAAHSTGIHPDPQTMSAAFEELFAHYASGSAWELFPETPAALVTLKSRGIGLAVVSNFDSRLHRVLDELGIAGSFDFILTSADAGARKPSPAIIRTFIDKSGADPSSCCLAGDCLNADRGAAESAGIDFFHINRPKTDLNDFQKWHRARFFPK